MNALQIEFTTKAQAPEPHARIARIGGRHRLAGQWDMTATDALKVIATGHYKFYVMVQGRRTYVHVAKTADGCKYPEVPV